MKIGHVGQELQMLGWKLSRDRAGTRLASFRLSDREVVADYGLTQLPEEQELWLSPFVETEAFSDAFTKICADHIGNDVEPIVVAQDYPCICVPEVLDQHVRQVSEKAIAWAQEQDLDMALRKYAALPTSSPGALPVRHLAALVLFGDVDRLKSYLKSFDAGDRLGFVPYITRDYIFRALQLAEDLHN